MGRERGAGKEEPQTKSAAMGLLEWMFIITTTSIMTVTAVN